MALFPPMILREKYFGAIEQEIQRLLDRLIYQPLVDLLNLSLDELRNAANPLVAAVERGQVWYIDGAFHGEYSARISVELRKLGAVYNEQRRTWRLDPGAVPPELRIAQANADSRYERLRQGLIQRLDDMDIESITQHSRMREKYTQAITWMNDDFYKAAAAITIPPKLTDAAREMIAEQWSTNLDLYIKGWASENILKLRKEIEPHIMAGGRAEGLVKTIRDNYGVSKTKARFLARQETSLLMSKFQQSRYQDMGVKQYKWSTSNDERVRPDHRALNNKVFSWDSPPITDRRTGARNHPGEDFNCRCVAIPWRAEQ